MIAEQQGPLARGYVTREALKRIIESQWLSNFSSNSPGDGDRKVEVTREV